MNVIAIDEVARTSGIREVLEAVNAGGAPDWILLKFRSLEELEAELRGMPTAIEALEIVAEGSPYYLDGISCRRSRVPSAHFAHMLDDIPTIQNDTRLYLSGCNTGCRPRRAEGGLSNAQLIANSTRAQISGTRGYIRGARALENDHCVPFLRGSGTYDGAVEADGPDCWRHVPRRLPTMIERRREPLGVIVVAVTFADHANPFTQEFSQQILDEIHRTRAIDAFREPHLRIAPDLAFSTVAPDGGRHAFELIGDGEFLRDPTSGEIWRFAPGDEMLRVIDARFEGDTNEHL